MLTRLRKIRPAGFVAGFLAAAVLGGGGVAYAANGGSFLLGSNNNETRGAGLANSNGTPLYLASKAGTPPLVVYSTTKVPRLNADALDGVDSTSFALAGGQTGYIAVNGTPQDMNGDGATDALTADATCPAGTKVTGGGVENYTGYPMAIDAPEGSNAWGGAVPADSTATAGDLVVYVVCYNPRGAVAGAQPTAAAAIATTSLSRTAQTPEQLLRDKIARVVKK